MMSCPDSFHWLDWLEAGGTSAPELEHLAHCVPCSSRLQALRETARLDLTSGADPRFASARIHLLDYGEAEPSRGEVWLSAANFTFDESFAYHDLDRMMFVVLSQTTSDQGRRWLDVAPLWIDVEQASDTDVLLAPHHSTLDMSLRFQPTQQLMMAADQFESKVGEVFADAFQVLLASLDGDVDPSWCGTPHDGPDDPRVEANRWISELTEQLRVPYALSLEQAGQALHDAAGSHTAGGSPVPNGMNGHQGSVASEQERLDAVIRQLELMVRANHTLDQARRDLIGLLGLPSERVDAAVGLVRQRMEDIRTRDIPRTMTAEGRESWYLGPDERQDIFWPALSRHLEFDGEAQIDVDRASTKVVSMLDHPGTGTFRTKGVVLGYVQSGKTTNFTATIAKSADAGYRLFIVLSGIHNGLRQQTQERLDRQLVALNPERWIALTDLEHDFRPNVNVNAFLAGEQKVLCVVKKNGTRLRHLRRWLEGAQDTILRACPTILIDDEADQASINTARDDNRPTTINRRIREILETLPKAAYIGYTATPFANVLIDPSNENDLYPRDFIVDLPRPSEYVGPEMIFGREPLARDGDDDSASDGLDMIRFVPEEELGSLRPAGRDLGSFEPAVTESLEQAIRYFTMSTAARRHRDRGTRHATMLIHTTMRVAVHWDIARLVEGEIAAMRARLTRDDLPLIDALRAQWDAETERVPSGDLPTVGFDDLRPLLAQVLDDVRVIVDNSQSADRLAYGGEPVTAIAVGGNTLSRGLTLEGLAVSFFVRTSNAYDTLLQMGRWFGYRRGYQDLPRIWMTEEMAGWFRHLATVEREIRYDVERYELEHRTPLDFGPRIACHPQLAITSAAKMRAAVPAEVSYSGRRLQTIRFRHRDAEWLAANLEATRLLLGDIVADGGIIDREPLAPGISLIRNVSSERVLEFLDRYRFSARSYDLNSAAISGYIRAQNSTGELQRFTVAVMGRGGGPGEHGSLDLGLDEEVPLIVRSRLRNIPGDEADIKALMSKEDRAVDLPISDAELDDLTNGELARLRNSELHGGIGDGSGLLAIYPIARRSAPTNDRSSKVRENLDAVDHVIGVGLVFPEAQTTEGRQTYMTADLRSLIVEEPLPEDELEEEPIEPAPTQ